MRDDAIHYNMVENERKKVRQALQDLKNGKVIEDSLAYKLNSVPHVDYCRELIQDSDAEWLKSLASSSSKPLIRELAISLMHPLCKKNNRDIRAYLENLWNSSDEYNIKMQVMWRLLDYDDLPVDLHGGIYKNFVVPNWNKWLPYIVDKFGGKEKVFSSCQKRLNNPSFPASKSWVYLCVATGCKGEEKENLKMLINQHLESKDSINSIVANKLLEDFS